MTDEARFELLYPRGNHNSLYLGDRRALSAASFWTAHNLVTPGNQGRHLRQALDSRLILI